MSNGWYIIANAETEDGHVMVRECWGSYAPDYQRTIEVTDGDTSFFITPEQMSILTEHLQEHADRGAADQEKRPGVEVLG